MASACLVAVTLALLFLGQAASQAPPSNARPNRPPPKYDAANDRGDNGHYPQQHFKTFDDVKVPAPNFLQWSPQCDDGLYYFITPKGYSLKNATGPMIFDTRGELVWAHHFENVGKQAYNFGVQSYKGKNHLTFWIGEDRVRGHGIGFNYILNSAYETVDIIGAVEGWADLHEFSIIKERTALMSVYDIVQKEEDSDHIWDCLVQEVDLRNRQLMWEWRASEHIELNETYRPTGAEGTQINPIDWFHLNSVQRDELGNYLLSSRYLHSIFYVDGRTKEIIWRLGGKKNSFLDQSGGNATNFAWQHDARFHPLDTFPNLYTPPPRRRGFTTKLLTLFDNASENNHYHYGLPIARGLLLEITYPTPGTEKALAGPQKVDRSESELNMEHLAPMSDLDTEKVKAINGSDPDYRVRVIMSYENPQHIRSSSQGNMQLIPQGPGEDPKVLIGYGLAAAWTEFTSTGTVLCNVHFGSTTSFETGQIQSYRVQKFPWTGRPRAKPRAMIDDGTLYMSWNGATDIAEWAVEASPTNYDDDDGESEWREVLRVEKTKFEESVAIPDDLGSARYYRVIAVDRNGTRMENGVSEPVDRVLDAFLSSNAADQAAPDAEYSTLFELGLVLACPLILWAGYRRYLLRRRSGSSFRWTYA